MHKVQLCDRSKPIYLSPTTFAMSKKKDNNVDYKEKNVTWTPKKKM